MLSIVIQSKLHTLVCTEKIYDEERMHFSHSYLTIKTNRNLYCALFAHEVSA